MNKFFIGFLVWIIPTLYASCQTLKLKGQLYSIVQLDQTESWDNLQNVASNNYLDIMVEKGKWQTSIGFESYVSEAIIGFPYSYEGSGISFYSLRYKSNSTSILIGHGYNTFNSGLIFRTWRDRQIGIDNPVLGLHLDHKFANKLRVKSFVGKQKQAFQLTEGLIFGSEIIIDCSSTRIPKLHFNASVIGNNESQELMDYRRNQISYSLGLDIRLDTPFSLSAEFVSKSKRFDQNNPTSRLGYSGNAALIEMTYIKKKWGAILNLRRLQNIGLFSSFENTDLNSNIFLEGQLNYIPSLTTIDQYSLKQLYTYAPQLGINLFENSVGDLGFDLNTYFKSKKNSFFGGKYGSKWIVSFSNWHLLNGTLEESKTRSGVLDFGSLLYQELNIAYKRKMSKKLTLELFANRKYYQQEILETKTNGAVKSTLFGTEIVQKLNKGSSLSYRVQYLFTKQDQKDWIASDIDYFINQNLSLSFSTLYNFLNTDLYFISGIRYSVNNLALSLGYYKTRDGFICAGGICRFVPGFTGVQLSTKYNFDIN